MPTLLLVTSALTFGLCAIHVVAGGREVHQPMQRSDLPLDLRAFSAVLWHAVTVVLLVMAAGTAWLAVWPDSGLALVLIAICLGWALLFVWYGQRMLGRLMPMPQWISFLVLAALIGWGTWG